MIQLIVTRRSKSEVSTLVEGSKLDEDVRSVSVQCNQVKAPTKIGRVDPRHGKSVASSCQLEPESAQTPYLPVS